MTIRKNQHWLALGWSAALLVGAAAVSAQDAVCDVPPELARSRPGAGGPATVVDTGVYVIDLRAIDDTEQSFNADVFVSMAWRDERLAAEGLSERLIGCRVPLDAVWHPRAQIINDRSLRKRGPDVVRIDEGGLLRYNQRYTGDFSFAFSFEDFPFDSHYLAVELLSFQYTPAEVEFRVDATRTGREEEMSVAEWTVGKGGGVVEPLYVEPAGFELARVILGLEVKRKTGFYLWKVLLPLCLIVMMSWAVFWINPTYLPSQIGVSTSAVLTLIAFQFSLGYMLPRLSYLTSADQFVMGSMALVFLAFGEAVLTGRLANREQLELAQKIDRLARWCFPIAFLAVIAFAFLI